MLPACSVMMSDMVRLHRRDPREQACSHFVAIDLVQHLVSSAGVEIAGDIGETRSAIAFHKQADAFEVVADGIVAAREEINRQVLSYLSKGHGIDEATSGREKRH